MIKWASRILATLVAVTFIATFFIPNIVRERTVYILNSQANAVGTGVIINDHMIMTNHHVVNGGTSFDVTLWNGETYKAEIVYDGPNPDMAVIKVEEKLPWWKQTVISCSSPQRLGGEYFTVGQTLGVFRWAYHKLIFSTETIGFKTQKALGNHRMVFANNSANHGNSGGGIFDWFGNQLGILTAMTQVNGFAVKDGKLFETGLAVGAGEVYGISTRDICPILKDNDIEFHQGYGIDDLLDFINRVYNKAYYEVKQL